MANINSNFIRIQKHMFFYDKLVCKYVVVTCEMHGFSIGFSRYDTVIDKGFGFLTLEDETRTFFINLSVKSSDMTPLSL